MAPGATRLTRLGHYIAKGPHLVRGALADLLLPSEVHLHCGAFALPLSAYYYSVTPASLQYSSRTLPVALPTPPSGPSRVPVHLVPYISANPTSQRRQPDRSRTGNPRSDAKTYIRHVR